ncbi:hypothetical protein GCM10007933_40840 [Zoogloea oryzae]|uniref:Uncharacterized protein n=1 Tax=Zoogloea oryzae TaxID=310767 RepID=A0ABQ6FJU9_9RHOO|nr:hypothetical protein [Zoogloea oryzae]GLT24597.1 hypothetical protein GCM10007933_40840 [Zoogloea oryzae]
MTRERKSDFEALIAYVTSYKIPVKENGWRYKNALGAMHKSYFSLITLCCEMKENKDIFLKSATNPHEELMERLLETASDMGCSLFNWINGSYKTSRIMIRTAIENFVRTIGALEDKALLSEKNVYSLFEKSAELIIFSENAEIKQAFNQLHSDYKLLCQDVHTASDKNMDFLGSLADFPSYKEKKGELCTEVFVRASRLMIFVFCFVFNPFFHQMHHRNKENILVSIKKSLRPMILGH